jgi:hypothetical protein
MTVLSTALKKRLHHLCATARQNAAANFYLMVQLRMIHNLNHRMYCASFGIVRAVDQAFDPSLHQRPGAHRARLNCNKQFAVSQAMVTNYPARLAQRQNLRMCRWVAIGDVAIPSTSDDLPAADNHCAYGDFAGFESALGAA